MGDWRGRDVAPFLLPSGAPLTILGLAEGPASLACTGPPARPEVGGKQDKGPLDSPELMKGHLGRGVAAAASGVAGRGQEPAQGLGRLPEPALT